ncbi:oxygen-independent coproporphyrinogen III oxidase [Spirosoma luteolum]
MTASLTAKYNVAGPRYTSYPTVPFWNTVAFCPSGWQQRLTTAFAESNYTNGISLYIHLPYCESLCTFCGCNKRITRNHGVEIPYIDTVLAEWALYCAWFPERPRLAELHLGGGTPSFFAPAQLKRLLDGLMALADPVEWPDFGWEGHPGNTTPQHLQVLFDAGFRRVSFGVQDYDPVVQRAIHRRQSVGQVQAVTEKARAIGYTSVSHDLVYGLPFQQIASIQTTIGHTLRLRPDRLSLYGYAHVPWVKGTGQRGFREADLPTGSERLALYDAARSQLTEAGYHEIGLDHFALPADPLWQAAQAGTLHRNFMGYTTSRTQVLIGLGVSAISDVGTAFMQNEKAIEAYQARVARGELPVMRGHLLTPADRRVRRQIMGLMCRFRAPLLRNDLTDAEWDALIQRLEPFRVDGLIDYSASELRVLPAGKPYVRTICMALDRYLMAKPAGTPLFSQTV